MVVWNRHIDYAISSPSAYSLHGECELNLARLVATAPMRTIRTRELAEVYAYPRQEARALERRGLLHRLAHGFYCAVPAEHDPATWQPTIEAAAAGIATDAFAAAKLGAWIDRGTPRDLYDLWAMSERDLIGPSALQVFIAYGPFGTPPAAWVFGQDLDEGEWTRALRHQTHLRVSAREAMTAVRQAWLRAAA